MQLNRPQRDGETVLRYPGSIITDRQPVREQPMKCASGLRLAQPNRLRAQPRRQ